MSYEVHVVRSERDVERVKQLRHAVFEVELSHGYAGLDESIDAHSMVLLWTRGQRAVGSARFGVRADGPLEDESVLELDRWKAQDGFTDAEIGQCSRLVVIPRLRDRGLAWRIMARLYAEAERRGVALIFIDASTPMVEYYLRLGFRRFCPSYSHPILGMDMHPLVLFMGDSEYFARVGSRLRRLAPVDTATRARAVYRRQFGLGA